MFHRVFSPSLDKLKTWFALNDELCVIPPRKFCSNGIFELFREEVCRVNIGDLEDENGGLVPLSWFNKGVKAADTLYAGTTFTLLAGNLRRKNIAGSGLLLLKAHYLIISSFVYWSIFLLLNLSVIVDIGIWIKVQVPFYHG